MTASKRVEGGRASDEPMLCLQKRSGTGGLQSAPHSATIVAAPTACVEWGFGPLFTQAEQSQPGRTQRARNSQARAHSRRSAWLLCVCVRFPTGAAVPVAATAAGRLSSLALLVLLAFVVILSVVTVERCCLALSLSDLFVSAAVQRDGVQDCKRTGTLLQLNSTRSALPPTARPVARPRGCARRLPRTSSVALPVCKQRVIPYPDPPSRKCSDAEGKLC